MTDVTFGIIGEYDPGDFSTEDRFREQVQRHLETTREMYTERGGLDMFTLVFCTRHPMSKRAVPLLCTICPAVESPAVRKHVRVYDDGAKDMLLATTRATAKRGRAVAVVLIAEASAAVARNDVDSMLMRNGVTRSRTHPDRKDVVWVSVEHRKWFAQGTALVTGPKQLGEWSVSYERPPVAGRFTDILRGL